MAIGPSKAQFVPGISDLPVADGLTVGPEAPVVFDTPAGRIVTVSLYGRLSKTAALEFSSKGVRVNTVCPGTIETPMIDRLLDDSGAESSFFVEKTPIGRLGKPQEIGDAVAWLLSDKASLVTGIALPVDGGWVA